MKAFQLTFFGILFGYMLQSHCLYTPPHFPPINSGDEPVVAPKTINFILTKDVVIPVENTELRGIESFVRGLDGSIYGSAYNGRIMRINADGTSNVVAVLGEALRGDSDDWVNMETRSRPLGMAFSATNSHILYVCDAWKGLLEVDVSNGKSTVLLNEIDGVPLNFANAVKVSYDGNEIYFTVSSDTVRIDRVYDLFFENPPTGKVIKYNLHTKVAEVLLRDLWFPNGLEMSGNGSALLIADSVNRRILKHYVTGNLEGQTFCILQNIQFIIDNLTRNPVTGTYYGIGVDQNSFSVNAILSSGFFSTLAVQILRIAAKIMGDTVTASLKNGTVVEFDESGYVLNVFSIHGIVAPSEIFLEDEFVSRSKFLIGSYFKKSPLWRATIFR